MEDQIIIDKYFARDEQAIGDTRDKYGRLLRSIAYGILKSHEDSEECENDTYLKTWNTIPPTRPSSLQAFLAKITRNLSLDRYDKMHAAKRGSGEVPLMIDELEECIPDSALAATDDEADGDELKRILDKFLEGLSPDARKVFMRRYFFGDSVNEIADRFGFGLSKVKMTLARTRDSLKDLLQKEGYYG
ncbi:MAG: RNA polymerase sigma factor [Saccharofermentans sp.]|jgi:RNA polymerase sigma-70 factor (ECF subfamily)|nr:RNA polymerase sigma factor [Saccharofermentans sp.]